MWQSPNQRVRAIANSKKRERERLQQQFHLRRVSVSLKLEPAASAPPDAPAEAITLLARAVLNDLSPQGIGLFVSQQLTSGEILSLTIHGHKPLEVRGRVVASQEFDNGSHILSQQHFTCRVGIQFIFDSPEKEREVKEYCQSIAGELLGGKAAA
ncbi:MAG: hypothetical protein A2X94_06745 [Bdellovibrionales bacterium GWB1_55_8]|nr:MAG: hypothetical protein A2X94_06745 [Bdellovibrionales bacterium GWB1_55_8]